MGAELLGLGLELALLESTKKTNTRDPQIELTFMKLV